MQRPGSWGEALHDWQQVRWKCVILFDCPAPFLCPFPCLRSPLLFWQDQLPIMANKSVA